MKNYIKLMRVHHYIKNILLFMALVCSGKLSELTKLTDCVIGFFAFCAVSSAVYIINDIRDREKDRLHPTKCARPIASGKVSIGRAVILAVALLVLAVVCSVLLGDLVAFVFLLVYFCINLTYSLGLKNIPLVDVSILVAGFVLRVLYGAVITDIQISNWLYLTVFAGAFFFALGKRRNEQRQQKDGDTRKVLKYYPDQFLDKSMYMCLTLMNVFYALWSMSGETAALYKSEYLIFTVPIVLLITLKYSMDIEGAYDGDPVEVLVHDKVLIVLCLLYALTMLAVLYLPRVI